MRKKKLDFENLRDVVWISAPALSGDGRKAAYVRGISDYDSGAIHTHIVETDLETGGKWAVHLTEMLQKEPVYSPDGKYLAFLASDGRPWQVWVKECGSGEVFQVSRCRYGAAEPVWSSDGETLAFEVKYYPQQESEDELMFSEMSASEYEAFQTEKKEQPKVFENLIYKLDSDYGMRDGSRTAIGVCKIRSRECRLVTPLDISYKIPSFVMGNRKIACYGYPHTHYRELNAELFLVDLGTGDVTQVEKSVPSYYTFPVIENEEGELLYCGVHNCGEAVLPEIYAVDPKGGESRLLFETWPQCHGLDPLYCGDTHHSQKDCPFAADEKGNIYFVSFSQGRSNVFCWDKTKVYAVTDEECVLGFSGPVNGRLLVLKSEWNHPAYLAVMKINTDRAEAQRLIEENLWLEQYELTEPKPVSAESKDGKAVVHGWMLVPQCEPGESLPAVLDVHGGPEACYVNGFFYEAQMMAARGMAVLYCDPRGSAGFGPEYMSDACAYGPEAVEDYQVFLQKVLQICPQIDAGRVGVTGGSYGGFMTNKLISVTDDFAAAVTQRTWVNPASSYGTGDMGFYSAGPQTESFREYMKNRVRKSIMKYIRNVHVPVLVLHGEQDYRCALEQGEQVYHALRSLKPELPVRIVIFPEENHGVTREGKLHNQIRYMKEMTEWFETYLKPGGQKR